jgi:hypothetical protein
MGWRQPRTSAEVSVPITSSGEGKLYVGEVEKLIVRLQQSLLHQ